MNKKPKKIELSFKKNLEIRAKEVRVTSEEGSPVMSLSEAIKLAESVGEDVVMINETPTPPIVKIIDYSKYVYQQRKLIAENKKKTQATEMKEIRLSVNIDSNDLKVKTASIEKFISAGHKVKCSIQLKGRENVMPERGQMVMLELAQSLEEIASVESMPKHEGRKWLMILKPIKK